MYDFLLCFAQYGLILLATVGIGCIGAAIGIGLRKRKNAKENRE